MRGRRMMGRRGPGLVGAMATTAVVAGTASAVSHGMNNRAAAKDQEAYAEQAAIQGQADIQDMQAQMAAMQAQQAQAAMQAQAAPAPAAPAPDLMGQLQKLAQLKEAGALTEEEYAAAKAKLLA